MDFKNACYISRQRSKRSPRCVPCLMIQNLGRLPKLEKGKPIVRWCQETLRRMAIFHSTQKEKTASGFSHVLKINKSSLSNFPPQPVCAYEEVLNNFKIKIIQHIRMKEQMGKKVTLQKKYLFLVFWTYILHYCIEEGTWGQLKRLNHNLSNALWSRIQCTSQVRM